MPCPSRRLTRSINLVATAQFNYVYRIGCTLRQPSACFARLSYFPAGVWMKIRFRARSCIGRITRIRPFASLGRLDQPGAKAGQDCFLFLAGAIVFKEQQMSLTGKSASPTNRCCAIPENRWRMASPYPSASRLERWPRGFVQATVGRVSNHGTSNEDPGNQQISAGTGCAACRCSTCRKRSDFSSRCRPCATGSHFSGTCDRSHRKPHLA